MTWAARILLVGVLALAAISVLSAAIAFAAPYLAAVLVLFVVGTWLLRKLDTEDSQ